MLPVLLDNFLRSKHMRVEGWGWRVAVFQLTFAGHGNQINSLNQEATQALPHGYLVWLCQQVSCYLPAPRQLLIRYTSVEKACVPCQITT